MFGCTRKSHATWTSQTAVATGSTGDSNRRFLQCVSSFASHLRFQVLQVSWIVFDDVEHLIAEATPATAPKCSKPFQSLRTFRGTLFDSSCLGSPHVTTEPSARIAAGAISLAVHAIDIPPGYISDEKSHHKVITSETSKRVAGSLNIAALSSADLGLLTTHPSPWISKYQQMHWLFLGSAAHLRITLLHMLHTHVITEPASKIVAICTACGLLDAA